MVAARSVRIGVALAPRRVTAATWASSTDQTLSNNGLTANRTGTGGFWGYEIATAPLNVGTVDFTIDAMGSAANNYVGINDGTESGAPGSNHSMFWRQDGVLLYASSTIATLAAWTTGDKLRIVDAAGQFTFYKWNGSAFVQTGSTIDSTSATYGLGNVLANGVYPSLASQNNTGFQVTADFSQWGSSSATNAYTLTCTTGTFSLTDVAVTPAVTMSAAPGAFTLTGTAATLAVTISASTGSFALTGNAALLKAARIFSLTTGTFTLTGNAATLAVGMSAGTGSFVLSGQSATLAASMPAATGAFVVTGNSATLAVRMTAAVGAFSLSGQAATLAVTMPALTGSFALTGIAATLTKTGANSITAATTSFALTGYAASLLAARRLAAVAASFSLTGSAASLGVTVPMGAGAFALTGYPGIFKRTLIFSAAGQTFVLRGFDAILDHEGKSVTYPLAGIPQPYPGTAASYPLTTAQAYPLTAPQTYPLEGIPQQYPLAS